MTSRDEAWLLKMPMPSSASEKMDGNPMEVNRPMPTMHHIASLPPMQIEMASKTTMVSEKIMSVRLASAWPNWNNAQHNASNCISLFSVLFFCIHNPHRSIIMSKHPT